MNNDTEREIRRCRDHLASIGTGMILFGVWGVIKFNMDLFMKRGQVLDSLPPEHKWVGILILVVLSIAICILIMGWYLCIGLSARSEGIRGKKRWLYLILAGIAVIVFFSQLLDEIIGFSERFENLGTGLVTVYIDLTMFATLIELLYAAIRSRILAKQLSRQE